MTSALTPTAARQFRVMIVISLVFVLANTSVVPVLPLAVGTFGVSRAGASLLLSSFALGRLAFDSIAGVLGDRFGIRTVAMVACLVFLAGSLGTVATDSYTLLLVARVAQGIGSSLYMTVAMAHVIHIAPFGSVGQLLSLYQGIVLIGMSVGPGLGGLLVERFGFRGPFAVHVLFAVFALVVSQITMRGSEFGAPERSSDADTRVAVAVERRAALRRLVHDPAFVLVLVVAFVIFNIRSGVLNTLVPLFAAERLRLGPSLVGALVTAGALGNLVVLLHAGTSVDRLGRTTVLRRSLIAMALVLIGLSTVHAPLLVLFLVVSLGAVKGYSGVVPGTVVADLAAPQVRKTSVGLLRTSTDAGLLTGPMIAGALADGIGFAGGFLVAASVVAASLLLVRYLRETGEVLDPPGRRLH